MSTIKELWVLQKHYNALLEIEHNLKEPSTLEKIKELGILLKNTEKKIENVKSKLMNSEKALKRSNILLADLEYQLKEIERNLYQESIADIKQLTLLDKEREKVSNDIENIEIDILKSMESIEKLKNEYENLTMSFMKYRKEYTRLVKEHRILMNQYDAKADVERKEIKKIMSTIDGKVLKRFENLIKTKRIAVVEVIDNRCSGCNMVLPSVILDKLKEDEKIILCENCHRILYFP